MEITKGVWKVGRFGFEVVSDGEHPHRGFNDPVYKKFAGGALIADNVRNPADLKLILSAPDLLLAVEYLRENVALPVELTEFIDKLLNQIKNGE